MESEKNALTVVGIFSLVVGLVAGYFIGDIRGVAKTESALLPIVETAFPKPPETMNSLTGRVVNAYGASFTIEIDDPDDYLPHLDGSSRLKQTRTVNVSANTEYSSVDYKKYDANGNPVRNAIALTDIAANTMVVVRSNDNIRDAKQVEAIEVERLVY